MSEAFVLGAPAALCLFRASPGTDVVKAALSASRIGAVNLAASSQIPTGPDVNLRSAIVSAARANEDAGETPALR